MKKLLYPTLIGLTSILFACETTEKIDDFPLRPSKLVVNSYLIPDQPWQFQLSKSLSVLDNAEIKLIDSASIRIFEDQTLIGTIDRPDVDGWYHWDQHQPVSGKTYSIEVTSPYFEAILSATETVPYPVSIDHTNLIIKDSTFYEWTDYYGRTYYGGNVDGTFEIRFQDPAGVENYYDLSIFYMDSVYQDEDSTDLEIYARDLFLTSEEASILDGSEGGHNLLIRDEFIDGQLVELKIDFNDYNARRKKVYFIKFNSLSENSFRYKQTNAAYLDAVNDPFAEPVQVHCNIENGYGIFAGMVTSYSFIMLQ